MRRTQSFLRAVRHFLRRMPGISILLRRSLCYPQDMSIIGNEMTIFTVSPYTERVISFTLTRSG